VNRPLHPLHGKKVEVKRVLRGKQSHLLLLRSPDGRNVQMRRDWTDFDELLEGKERPPSTTAVDAGVDRAKGAHGAAAAFSLKVDVGGLREVSKIVERLKAGVSRETD
jgi:hypothetical protein